MQVYNHSQVQPALAGPDIADVARPLLVWTICDEATIQQVRRDAELVVAFYRHLVCAGPSDRYAVLSQRSANTAYLDQHRKRRHRFRQKGF